MRRGLLYRACLPLGPQVTWNWDPSEATIIRHLRGLAHQARQGNQDTSPGRAARGATGCSTGRPSGHRETGGRLTSTPGGPGPQTVQPSMHVTLPSMHSMFLPPQVEVPPEQLDIENPLEIEVC